MNTRTMILIKWLSILSYFLAEIMCYSNLVVISPTSQQNQPALSASSSTHRQSLTKTSYTRDQLVNMSRQLKSCKYCILPHSVINTIQEFKINKCPSKLGARHNNYTSKVNTKNLVHVQLGTEQNLSSNVRVATVNTRSVKNKSDIIIETSKLENLDFLIISETWLGEDDAAWVPTSSLNTQEYRIQTINRQEKKEEGLHFYTRIYIRLLGTPMHLN